MENDVDDLTINWSKVEDRELIEELEIREYLVISPYASLAGKVGTNELIEELEARGFQVTPYDEIYFGVDGIVQMHRCGDPRWEQLAVEYLYNMANKVV